MNSVRISKPSINFQTGSSQEIGAAMQGLLELFWLHVSGMSSFPHLLSRFIFWTDETDEAFYSNMSRYIALFMISFMTCNAPELFALKQPSYHDTPTSILHCGCWVLGIINTDILSPNMSWIIAKDFFLLFFLSLCSKRGLILEIRNGFVCDFEWTIAVRCSSVFVFCVTVVPAAFRPCWNWFWMTAVFLSLVREHAVNLSGGRWIALPWTFH